MIYDITSSDNHTYKQTKQLLVKKFRDEYKEFSIEGLRIIMDAIDNKKEIKRILFNDTLYKTAGGEKLLKICQDKGYPIYKISDKMFRDISDTKNPQGILAVLSYEEYDISNIFNKDSAFLLLLDRIQDPGNLGTILRTADAAGIDGVLITKGSVDIYNPKTIRSTMGSIFHLPIIPSISTDSLLPLLDMHGFDVISTTLDTNTYLYDISFSKKTVIVIGNEANGICPDIINKSDILIKIPMFGKAESLNAAVAASIIIYESARQKYIQKI